MLIRRRQLTVTPLTSRRVSIYLLPILLVNFSLSHASPLFDDDSVIEVTLTGPLQSLIDSKAEGNDWPFVLQADGRDYQIKVRARGNSRLDLCQFPLLRLNFRSDETFGSVFDGQDKLKVVNHCRSYDAAQVDTLQEYAAYRIFEVISDFSYKTRLLRVTYSDSEGRLNGGDYFRYAFLIESEDELERRINGELQHLEGVLPSSLNQQQAALVYIFHYLIGNTDWSLVTAEGATSCCHNGHLYAVAGEIVLVPNDFDLSGLVNTRYAKPHPTLRISRVTQRRYRGYCISTEYLSNALTSIRAKQEQILAVFDEIPGLSAKEIKRNKKYLKGFFDRAQNQQKMLKRFEARCIG